MSDSTKITAMTGSTQSSAKHHARAPNPISCVADATLLAPAAAVARQDPSGRARLEILRKARCPLPHYPLESGHIDVARGDRYDRPLGDIIQASVCAGVCERLLSHLQNAFAIPQRVGVRRSAGRLRTFRHHLKKLATGDVRGPASGLGNAWGGSRTSRV